MQLLQQFDLPSADVFDCDNVRNGIIALKNNKSLGNTFVTPEILKYFNCTPLCECLALMFNYVGEQGVPNGWNVLNVTSLYKNKGARDDAHNYRGLSVMSTIPKLYSIVLNNMLY